MKFLEVRSLLAKFMSLVLSPTCAVSSSTGVFASLAVWDYCLFFFAENYVDGKEFLSLTFEEIREMVPLLGLAKKLLRLIPQVRKQIG